MRTSEESSGWSDDPVGRLLAECLEAQDLAARRAALERACGEHRPLERELRERFGALESVGLVSAPLATDSFPERMGEFQLLDRLGSGGMGVVYRAVQEPLGREVALKLIRPDQLYFPRARERFRREIEAVARLNHPGIVPVYTVGEADGVPYFAMELVEGASLAQVLAHVAGRAPEALSGADLAEAVGAQAAFAPAWPEACADLVGQVAAALEHAHERGVLHRDIKPSNILVTPDGRARLLDFGLASSLGQSQLTRTGSAVGSVLYMSPEQVLATEDLDARSDVYSLGVTLYELLSLQPPYIGDGPLGTQQAILAGSPDPIRARNRAVSRELETVCLVAMERESSRRYASARAFAEELGRVREKLPIRARPPGAALRVRRWAQRNPAAATALVMGLVGGIGTPSVLYVQQRDHSAKLGRQVSIAEQATLEAEAQRRVAEGAREEADRQRDQALLEKRDSDAVATFMLDLFASSDPNVALGEDMRATEILARGVQRIESELLEQPELRARLLGRMGRSYASLGAYAEARPLLEQSVELLRGLHGERDAETCAAMIQLARMLRIEGRPGAVEIARHVLDVFGEVHGPAHPRTVDARIELAAALAREGDLDSSLGLLDEAMELGGRGPVPDLQRANVLSNQAFAMNQEQRYAEAEPLAREAYEIYERVHAGPHPGTVAALNHLAVSLKNLGRFEEAGAAFERLLEMAVALYTEESDLVALFQSNHGRLLQEQGRIEEAEARYRGALAVFERVAEPDNLHALNCRDHLGDVLALRMDWTAARVHFGQVCSGLRAHPTDQSALLVRSLTKLARCHVALADLEGGEACLREALDLQIGRQGASSARARILEVELGYVLHWSERGRDEAHELLETSISFVSGRGDRRSIEVSALGAVALGRIEERLGLADSARARFEAVLARPASRNGFAAVARGALGASALEEGRHEEAEAQLLAAHAALVELVGEAHVETREVAARLVELYGLLGLAERAAEFRAR